MQGARILSYGHLHTSPWVKWISFWDFKLMVPKHDIGGTRYVELEILTGKWALWVLIQYQQRFTLNTTLILFQTVKLRVLILYTYRHPVHISSSCIHIIILYTYHHPVTHIVILYTYHHPVHISSSCTHIIILYTYHHPVTHIVILCTYHHQALK